MDESNPYQSSGTRSEPQGTPPSDGPRLMLVLLGTSVGCALAAAVGYWGAIFFDSISPALVAMAVLPAVGSWLAGVRDPDQLFKIAVYGVVVWLLCFSLQPAVAGRLPPGTPKVKIGWVGIAFAPSSLLAVIGAGFACRTPKVRDLDR
ncbi:hypothetical protein NG895_06460 [Aeoliella sp. ICT_H6.2]|uniref:Uncharacterized protein n=1 Tax=Aeoliella straminimaris TaxID=2954799 RepID=A0A9X2F7A1_9BACT|nr:hypothetical protein [Aeoliella straminimaris]MCO6043545.1 hypothetical protein [Aeoliella straminimaris]